MSAIHGHTPLDVAVVQHEERVRGAAHVPHIARNHDVRVGMRRPFQRRCKRAVLQLLIHNVDDPSLDFTQDRRVKRPLKFHRWRGLLFWLFAVVVVVVVTGLEPC